jgi:hypothetical protein
MKQWKLNTGSLDGVKRNRGFAGFDYLDFNKMNNEHELADKKLGIEKLRLEKEMLELRRSLSSQTASNGS